MANPTPQKEIAVIGPKGQRATVVAVPNPAYSLEGDDNAELVYGMDGLRVDKISDYEFRDFQGTIWTVDVTAIP